MTERNVSKERLFLSFFIVAILLGVAASATIVGPDGIYDTDYLNGTTVFAKQIFIGNNNVTQTIIDSGSAWDGTGALFQNGTRELTANWDTGEYNLTTASLIADNVTADDIYLSSIGNLTAYIDSGGASNATIDERIELWNELGLGATYLTTTNFDFIVRNVTIAGDNYAYLVNGTDSSYMGSSREHNVPMTWAYGNITDPERTFERTILIAGYFDNMAVAVDMTPAGNSTTTVFKGMCKFNASVNGENMFEFNGANAEGITVGGLRFIGGLFDGYRSQITGPSNIFFLNITANIEGDNQRPIEFRDQISRQVWSSTIYIDAYDDIYNLGLCANGEFRFENNNYRFADNGITLKGGTEIKITGGEYSGDDVALYLVGGGPAEIIDVYTNGGMRFRTFTTLNLIGGFHDTAAEEAWITGQALRWSLITGATVRVVGSHGNTDAPVIQLESYDGVHSIHNTVSTILAGRMQFSGTNQWSMFVNETDANQDWNTYEDLTISSIGDFSSTQLFQISGANSKVESEWVDTLGRFSGAETKYGTYVTDADDAVFFGWVAPPQLNQIVRIRIYGQDYTGDADGGINLDIEIAAGSINEAWNTHTFTLDDFTSSVTNPVTAHDIITWDITGADNAILWDISAGDAFAINITQGDAGGNDAETDATIKGILIEWG